jgi:hypothetical protein
LGSYAARAAGNDLRDVEAHTNKASQVGEKHLSVYIRTQNLKR